MMTARHLSETAKRLDGHTPCYVRFGEKMFPVEGIVVERNSERAGDKRLVAEFSVPNIGRPKKKKKESE